MDFGEDNAVMKSLIQTMCVTCCQAHLTMTASTDLHISLSKTLGLRLHWIQPITDNLRARLLNLSK